MLTCAARIFRLIVNVLVHLDQIRQVIRYDKRSKVRLCICFVALVQMQPPIASAKLKFDIHNRKLLCKLHVLRPTIDQKKDLRLGSFRLVACAHE